MGLGQYNSLGEYCDPHTAASVFHILTLLSKYLIPSINSFPLSRALALSQNGGDKAKHIAFTESGGPESENFAGRSF